MNHMDTHVMSEEIDALIRLMVTLMDGPLTYKDICTTLDMGDDRIQNLLKILGIAHVLSQSHATYALRTPDISEEFTFMRAPSGTVEELTEGTRAVVGIPYDGGKSMREGAYYGPSAIRQVSQLLCEVTSCGTPVLDVGTIPVSESLFETRVNIYNNIKAIVNQGGIPVSLGGDHSIAYPCIRAVSEMNTFDQIWFDAHLDTHPTSMEWRVGAHGTVLTRCLQLESPSETVVLIGVRSVSPAARSNLASKGVIIYDMQDIRARGIEAVTTDAVDQVTPPVYVSVDLDAVDPHYAPGVGSPAPGGMTPQELITCCSLVRCTLDMVGCDMVELFPPHDTGCVSALIAAAAVKTLCL
jgi:agmatinase